MTNTETIKTSRKKSIPRKYHDCMHYKTRRPSHVCTCCITSLNKLLCKTCMSIEQMEQFVLTHCTIPMSSRKKERKIPHKPIEIGYYDDVKHMDEFITSDTCDFWTQINALDIIDQ